MTSSAARSPEPALTSNTNPHGQHCMLRVYPDLWCTCHLRDEKGADRG